MDLIEFTKEEKALMKILNKAKLELKKNGFKPSRVYMNPSTFCCITNTKPHKQWDSEISYGRICGLDIYIDERIDTIYVQ